MADRTEQEAHELEQLQKNSPFALPDNAAASGWTTAQIKEKFYAGLFYLYKLFKELRVSNDSFTEDVAGQIVNIEAEVRAVLENLTAEFDIDGNAIISTYAKIANITNGSIAALKYIKENGTTENIRKIADDLTEFVTQFSSYFNNDKAKKAEIADRAELDGAGKNIFETYATKTALQNLTSTVNNLLNGTTVVAKALKDSEGNPINTTYVKKVNIVNALDDTSTDKPLSANQGKVLKGLIDGITAILQSNDTDLDTVQEIVTYIKNNKTLIENITSSKVNVADIVDNVTSQISNKPLSANQGYILAGLIEALTTVVGTKANSADVYPKSTIDAWIAGIVLAALDDELDEESHAAIENQAVAKEVNKKANKDGNYPTLTSGQALSIYSDREISDADQSCPPITIGTAGGNAKIQNGYQKLEEIRGNTVKFNQLFRTVNMVNPVTTNYGITYQRNATTGVCTFSGTSTSESNNQISLIAYNVQADIISSHKFLLKWNLIGIKPAISEASTNLLYGNNEGDIGTDVVFNGTVRTNTYAQIFIKAGATVNFSIQPQIFDLTELFGAGNEPTIENIAELYNLYPLPHYEYNAGQLLSSKSSALESIGMNQFDGEIEGNSIDSTTGQNINSSDSFRSKNYIEVIQGEKYSFSYGTFLNGTAGYIFKYDGNKNFIERESFSSRGFPYNNISIGENTRYVRLAFYKNGSGWGTNPPTQEQAQIMLCLYHDTENVPYKPYEKQTVNLPNIELRSAGSVYDVIYSSGNGKRRVWLVKLTDLSWNYAAGSGTFANTFRGTLPTGKNGKYPSAYSAKANLICNAYKTVSLQSNEYQGGTDKTICLRGNTTIQIQDSQYNGDLQAFLNANANTYIQYELETEEDITSDPFTELVKVDNYGTLKFVSSQTIQVPQAYFIRYTVSLTEWLDSAYAYTDGKPSNLALKSYVDTAIAQIPTGDFGFPLITAPSSTSLSADEITSITSGCVVNGTFLGIANPVFFKAVEIWGIYFGLVIGVVENNRQPLIQSYQIQNGTIALRADTQQVLDIHNVNSVNGKNIPAYPSSTGTFVLKCVDGTLKWVAE